MSNISFILCNKKNIYSILATMISIGTVGMSIGFSVPLISYIMIKNHISNSLIGYSGTIGGFATIIAAMLTSKIVRYFGFIQSMLLMLIGGGLSFLGFYIFQSLWIWIFLRFILHFAMTIIFILSEFWINESAPPTKRCFILAIYASILGIGFSLGPILFSIINHNGCLPFIIVFLIIILATIPIILAWNFRPLFKEKSKILFLNYIFKIPTSNIAVFIFGAIQMGTITLITPFGIIAGYSEYETNKFITLISLGSAILLFPISILSDYIRNRFYILIGCSSIGTLGALLIPFIINNHHIILKIDLFILGGVSTGLYIISLAQIGANLKDQELASANSAFIFCYGLGMLIGPAVIGQTMELYNILGFSTSIAAFFGLYIIIFIILSFFKTKKFVS